MQRAYSRVRNMVRGGGGKARWDACNIAKARGKNSALLRAFDAVIARCGMFSIEIRSRLRCMQLDSHDDRAQARTVELA
jgi:hypothetical protein